MFSIDTEEIKQFESDLKTYAERSYPFAVRETLKKAAFETRERTQIKIKNQMITRNKFTVNSIQVEKMSNTLRVNQMEAVVGSTAPYMDEQEFGAIKSKTGKHGVDIPTTVASNEGRGAQPRRRKVIKSRRLGSIHLQNKRPTVKSKKQENFLRIQQAVSSGRKFVFLDFQRHPGIYRVSGGKRNAKIDLVHDFSRKSVIIPKNPTLGPATKEVQQQMPRIYREALVFQLKRQGLFKR
jgi:hypothetical protein